MTSLNQQRIIQSREGLSYVKFCQMAMATSSISIEERRFRRQIQKRKEFIKSIKELKMHFHRGHGNHCPV